MDLVERETDFDLKYQSGKAYRCFCTPERLDNVREKFKKARKQQSYDGYCTRYTEEQAEQMEMSGKPFVVRFKVGQVILGTDCYVDCHPHRMHLNCNPPSFKIWFTVQSALKPSI